MSAEITPDLYQRGMEKARKRSINAQHAGLCATCARPFYAGDEIVTELQMVPIKGTICIAHHLACAAGRMAYEEVTKGEK